MIPGANILADVAAEDLAADAVAEIFGDGAALLDGQVGDAAGGVHLIRREGLRGAGVDAAGAGSAAVGSERRQFGGGEFERSEDDSEEKPGAELLVKDAGVFARPAEAGIARINALDERTGIDIAARLEGADCLTQRSVEGFEALEQNFVIIRRAHGCGGF